MHTHNMSSSISLSLTNCTISPPSLSGWIYAFSVHGVFCIFGGVPCAVLLYYLRAKNSNSSSIIIKDGTKTVIGIITGVLAAAAVPIGRPAIESYSPNSEITFIGPFLASAFGFTTFFKSLNAVFGTYPEGADRDLLTWMLWFVMTPEPTFVKGKTSKASWKEIVAKLRDFFLKVLSLFFLLTISMRNLESYKQAIVETPSSPPENTGSGESRDVFSSIIETHARGFFYLWFLYSFVSLLLDFSTITNYVLSSGVRTEPGFCNPLLESRSFKETWGTRWNRPVNALLKRTVYVPARKSGYCNQKVAAIMTFLASGLLHEYNFLTHNDRSGYRPGEITIFFLFMGTLMVVESLVWDRYFPRWLQIAIERLPSAVTASILTLMVSGIAEHCFLQPWIRSGFVDATAQLMLYLDCR